LKTLLFRMAVIVTILFSLYACTNNGSSSEAKVFKQIPELQEIKPVKPVKIKLKRNAQGEYSWDLSGNDADKIIEADKKLRQSFKK